MVPLPLLRDGGVPISRFTANLAAYVFEGLSVARGESAADCQQAPDESESDDLTVPDDLPAAPTST